jgi:hypothetical protein
LYHKNHHIVARTTASKLLVKNFPSTKATIDITAKICISNHHANQSRPSVMLIALVTKSIKKKYTLRARSGGNIISHHNGQRLIVKTPNFQTNQYAITEAKTHIIAILGIAANHLTAFILRMLKISSRRPITPIPKNPRRSNPVSFVLKKS